MPETAYTQISFDPPAPVMGGMRWARPLPGPDPFWERWERRRRSPGIPAPQTVDTTRAPEGAVPAADIAPYAFLITSTPPTEARVGDAYEYRPRAYDSDTNGFTWHLEKNVPGMAIDRYTGVITWTPAKGGWVEVTLCARNVYGKIARQSWTLCVRKAAVVRAPVNNPRYRAAVRRRRRAPRRSRPVLWRVPRGLATPRPRAAAPPDLDPDVSLPLRR